LNPPFFFQNQNLSTFFFSHSTVANIRDRCKEVINTMLAPRVSCQDLIKLKCIQLFWDIYQLQLKLEFYEHYFKFIMYFYTFVYACMHTYLKVTNFACQEQDSHANKNNYVETWFSESKIFSNFNNFTKWLSILNLAHNISQCTCYKSLQQST